jgi:hypothetical protein
MRIEPESSKKEVLGLIPHMDNDLPPRSFAFHYFICLQQSVCST